MFDRNIRIIAFSFVRFATYGFASICFTYSKTYTVRILRVKNNPVCITSHAPSTGNAPAASRNIRLHLAQQVYDRVLWKVTNRKRAHFKIRFIRRINCVGKIIIEPERSTRVEKMGHWNMWFSRSSASHTGENQSLPLLAQLQLLDWAPPQLHIF